MKLKSIKPLFGLVLVFMLGAVSGSLITYMAARAHFFETISGNGTHMREEVLVKRLARQLDLDGRQQARVKFIIHETRGRIHQIRQKTHPEIETVMTDSHSRIRALLSPQQQEIFKKMLEEHRARRRMEGHRHGGGE